MRSPPPRVRLVYTLYVSNCMGFAEVPRLQQENEKRNGMYSRSQK